MPFIGTVQESEICDCKAFYRNFKVSCYSASAWISEPWQELFYQYCIQISVQRRWPIVTASRDISFQILEDYHHIESAWVKNKFLGYPKYFMNLIDTPAFATVENVDDNAIRSILRGRSEADSVSEIYEISKHRMFWHLSAFYW
eukprot:Gb_28840 [translate_table: standard]